MMVDHGERPPYLVLGLGNTLLSDDGVGVELLQALRAERDGDPRFEFVDGGTLGLSLIGLFEGRRGVLLLDAQRRGAPPGTIHVSDALQVAGDPRRSSAHESDAADLLAVVRLIVTRSGPIVLLGVEPGELGTGCGLSPAVRRAFPRALQAARTALRRLVSGWQPLPDEVQACTS